MSGTRNMKVAQGDSCRNWLRRSGVVLFGLGLLCAALSVVLGGRAEYGSFDFRIVCAPDWGLALLAAVVLLVGIGSYGLSRVCEPRNHAMGQGLFLVLFLLGVCIASVGLMVMAEAHYEHFSDASSLIHAGHAPWE